MTTNNNMMQETLFSFLGEEEPTPITPSTFQPSTKPKVAAKGKPQQKVESTPKEEEKLEITMETIIRYGGETLPITDYFNQDEISQGIRLTEEGKEGEHRPITGEDIRKRMEDEFGELIEGLTTMVFNKEKNMVVPVLQARKKGLDIEAIGAKQMTFICESSHSLRTKWIPKVKVNGEWALIADGDTSSGLKECDCRNQAISYAKQLKEEIA